jgi:hypothetical protein
MNSLVTQKLRPAHPRNPRFATLAASVVVGTCAPSLLAGVSVTTPANGTATAPSVIADSSSGLSAEANAATSLLRTRSFGTGNAIPWSGSGLLGVDAVVDMHYKVFGLAPGAQVTFAWEFAGARAWNPDGASFNSNLRTGIYNQVGDTYIYNVGWGISYADGPVWMGDFAGNLSAPFGLGGVAGNPANYSSSLPVGSWDGIGLQALTTTYRLEDGWEGQLGFGAGFGAAGDLNADYTVRFLGATVPSTASLLNPNDPGSAYLRLENNVIIPITVPEPSAFAVLSLGLLAFSTAFRRRS